MYVVAALPRIVMPGDGENSYWLGLFLVPFRTLVIFLSLEFQQKNKKKNYL